MERFDLDAIRAKLPMLKVCEGDGMVFKKEGGNWLATCPFHTQRGRSFTVHANEPNHAHCYGAGCAWDDGDIFKFWQWTHNNCSFPEAVAALAGLAGVGPVPSGVVWKARPKVHRAETLAEAGKPLLPDMRLLRADERAGLAALRGVSVAAVDRATEERVLGFGYWPLSRDTGREYSGSRACWVVTDDARWCAQFRRLDGKEWDCGGKAMSTKNIRWPVGVANLRGRKKVLMVEGSPDMLAGWHLVEAAGMAAEVAVVSVFGGAAALAGEALELLRGCRVLIAAHADEPIERTYKARPAVSIVPGLEAAARWQWSLESAGVRASVADLSPLKDYPGGGKDLNDLVRLAGADIDPCEFLDF